MKKALLTFCVSILLLACHARVKQTPSTPEIQPSSVPAETVDASANDTPLQQASSTSSVQKPTSTPVNTPKQPQANAAESSQKQPFTQEQASVLIAQDKQKQTLAKPQEDTPSFKKEELLPTTDRLLSPFAYEPVTTDHTNAPWSNESLQYGIYYSFIKAGTAYIKTRGLTNINGKMAYLIQTTAFSAAVIDSVFKVRDINYSWIDANTYHSLGDSQSVREGNYKRDEWITFDNQNKRFYGQVQKKKEPSIIAGELEMEVLDMLSSLYYVRMQPLEVGKDVTFDIINRAQQYPLVVKVLGKETIKTNAGKFNCWVVEPQFRGEGIFVAKGKSLKVWLTDDKYRMPVKMSVEVFIGSVYAELLAYTRN